MSAITCVAIKDVYNYFSSSEQGPINAGIKSLMKHFFESA
jgi:hypothetical protein